MYGDVLIETDSQQCGLEVVIQDHHDVHVGRLRGEGVLQCNGWPTLLLNVPSGQLVLRPPWSQSSSVITKVKNPLKRCSVCEGSARMPPGTQLFSA